MIDFRSDTVTKPTPAMLDAMMQAKVGDDVFEEDPTINQLEAMTAEMFGKEAGIFCPSGTMTNQIAIKLHTQPADEVICEELSHIYQYEGGGIAFNSGCSVRLLKGSYGRIHAQQVKEAINPDNIHKPATTLVSLENTCNRGGGSCYNFQDIIAIKEVCNTHNLALHLDGARIFNAIIAQNETPKQYGEVFDTISICLSKGLGTPVGSVLVGSQKMIKKAKRIRKVLGGGMRQAGYLAAAGIYALQHNIKRLAQDHTHATLIAQALQQKSYIGNIFPVSTNIIIAEIVGTQYTPDSFAAYLKEHQILVMPMTATQVRLVTHLDISPEMVAKTIQVINLMP